MAAMSKSLQAELLTDSRELKSLCDSDANQHSSIRDSLGIVPSNNSSTFAFAPQSRPNEQFYCTSNEVVEERHPEDDSSNIRIPISESGTSPVKVAAEVAAAARFISQVDIVVFDKTLVSASHVPSRPRLGSITSVRDSIFDSPLRIPKSRSSRMQPQPFSKRTVSRPPPLQLDQISQVSEEIQSPLPTRTSSKGAPSFDFARPPDSAKLSVRSVTSPGLVLDLPKSPLVVLTPESANTFQFNFSFPTEPQLSRSASDATADSEVPITPADDIFEEDRPIEDQIRRDIEAFALEHGPFLRGSQPRIRRAPIAEIKDAKQEGEKSDLPPLPAAGENDTVPIMSATTSPVREAEQLQTEDSSSSPTPRRKKSMFGWLQKRPDVEVDDLIDLYLTEDQKEEVEIIKRKTSKSSMTIPRNRVVTDPLPMHTG